MQKRQLTPIERDALAYYGVLRGRVTDVGLRRMVAMYEQGLDEADALFRMTERERALAMATVDAMVSASVQAPVGLDRWAFSRFGR